MRQWLADSCQMVIFQELTVDATGGGYSLSVQMGKGAGNVPLPSVRRGLLGSGYPEGAPAWLKGITRAHSEAL